MNSAAELRRQVESTLASRIPGALSFRPQTTPELLSCGVAEVDAVLGGGLPLGAITELTGSHSSGRTTLALATLAKVTQQGESCAYIDVSDALDPLSAAALGVDLRRLLWVRIGSCCGNGRSGYEPCAWSRLDHALRATDLLLSTGGFRAIVLDMGDVPPEQARRVPLATWYRFRLQAEKSRTLFLLMTCVACANSCAAVSLHCRQGTVDWRAGGGEQSVAARRVALRVSVERSRAVDPTAKNQWLPPKPSGAALRSSWSR